VVGLRSADIVADTSPLGYISAAVILLGLLGVVIVAVRRWLKAPKD
jgi:uncharacterized membrane-anchored protein